MTSLRAFFMGHRSIAFMVIVAAFFLKSLLPSGYMIGQDNKILTVQICHDSIGETVAKQVVIPMKDEPLESAGKQAKGDCAFSSLSMASMVGADPALLAIALVFIIALGFAPTQLPRPKPFSHLRPPLRGPPALI